ncbi:MAG: DNA polymerase III subunit alpha [Rhodospirillaceae bacterium]|nr:DNA polymerase III subunit alpha [Rhodospirillaceae bacterium]MBT5780143.1 DNA polymerase III subunit alpha [Rhodospirillaceae bacterium]
MSHANFVHLRVHSAYSLSEGAIKIDELAQLCRSEKMPAVAMTDRNNLFGALEFSQACAKSGVQPILGCELALRRSSAEDSRRKTRAEEPAYIALLVQNEIGWRNLMALSSTAYLATPSGETPQIDMACLADHSDGLLALSGGPHGPLGALLLDGQSDAARDLALQFAEIFPGRFYIELMRHGMEEETRIEPALVDLAYAHDVPLLATNNVYFGPRDKYEAHDALMCIAQSAHIDDRERDRLTPEHFFRPAEEMRELFADLPEAVENTLVVAQRCAFQAPEHAPILPAYPMASGVSEASELRTQAEDGLARRLEQHVFKPEMSDAEKEEAAKPYRERLNFELGVIVDMKFPGYFLIVAEFIHWAKSENIPVGPGRGSGAGSVVAWALTITDLDPLRFDLLFERFLNPERVSMPDFDIDFCQDKRDRVIDHVCDQYGRDRVAQIITFGKLQARAVIRDVGRVLAMPYGQVDRLSKLVPFNPANPVTLQQAIDGEPQFQAMVDEDQAVGRLLKIALQLEGLYRHASTHAAGVVIGDRPLQELVPLYRDPRSEMPVTQYSMKYVERAGLVKFDFLGLKTLSVLEMASRLVRDSGTSIELDALPLDDRGTFEMLGKGASMGVFQLESSGMRDVLRSMKPDTFEDIIALVALYRPGPMGNIPKFIACKHGEEEPDYMHESLEGILRETYGVIVYQEQVMQIAQVLSGYSLGGADLLRRAMGKKIKSEMDAQREVFVQGAMDRGIAKAKASQIFELVAKFADYGFNKSHAAAYALVAYQTAYFKANYAVEFMAASMSFELKDTDKIAVFRQELERIGITLLAPDINASGVNFSVEDGTAIRYALAAVKNVGDAAMRAVVAERESGGAFESVFEFTSRMGAGVVNKRQLENLVRAGAFDNLEPNRRKLFEAVELLIRHGESADRNSGQDSLFGSGPNMGMPEPVLSDIPDWPPLERLNYEQEAIGFYLSSHPLEAYATVLDGLNTTECAQLVERANDGVSSVQVAGVVLNVQERDSNGRRFAFVQLSDPTGSYEVAFFQEAFSSAREHLEPGRFLLIRANIRAEGDSVKLTAQGAEDLERKAVVRMKGLEIQFAESTPLAPLKSILERQGTGAGRIMFVVKTPQRGDVELTLKESYALSPAVRAEIDALPGVLSVKDLQNAPY